VVQVQEPAGMLTVTVAFVFPLLGRAVNTSASLQVAAVQDAVVQDCANPCAESKANRRTCPTATFMINESFGKCVFNIDSFKNAAEDFWMRVYVFGKTTSETKVLLPVPLESFGMRSRLGSGAGDILINPLDQIHTTSVSTET
jgi:hypothetical protein